MVSGGLTLTLMILPTIIRTAEEAIKMVPRSFREGSLALGATKWQTIYKVVLPAAIPGILTGVILGIGRVVGETAAVIYTAGSSLGLPNSIWRPGRTMAVHLYILASEGLSKSNMYATATVLIITVLIINLTANRLIKHFINA
jgi:phosphate transport system permease protein